MTALEAVLVDAVYTSKQRKLGIQHRQSFNGLILVFPKMEPGAQWERGARGARERLLGVG